MTTESSRNVPIWVPIVTAVVGALVGFGLIVSLGGGDDDTTVATGAEAVATATPDLEPTATAAPDPTATAAPEPTPTAVPTATPEPAPTATPVPPAPTATPVPPAPAPTATSAPAAPPAGNPPAAGGGTISRARAGQIAAAHVGGTVDSISREDDYGAAWDVDVYAPDGEYTIYVSATGEIVRVEGPFRD